jgi:hypothetical protein
MSESLWRSSDPPRFFLIPDEVTPPPGDFTIRSLTGERRRVNSAALAYYERTQEQATEWLQGKLGKVLEDMRGWLDNAADRLTGADVDPLGALREAVDRTQHLAMRITTDVSRHNNFSDIQTMRSIAAKLHVVAQELDSLTTQAAAPM